MGSTMMLFRKSKMEVDCHAGKNAKRIPNANRRRILQLNKYLFLCTYLIIDIEH